MCRRRGTPTNDSAAGPIQRETLDHSTPRESNSLARHRRESRARSRPHQHGHRRPHRHHGPTPPRTLRPTPEARVKRVRPHALDLDPWPGVVVARSRRRGPVARPALPRRHGEALHQNSLLCLPRGAAAKALLSSLFPRVEVYTLFLAPNPARGQAVSLPPADVSPTLVANPGGCGSR